MKFPLRFGFPVLLLLTAIASLPSNAQDWVHTGSGLNNAPIRLAAADFKLVGADAQTPALKATFDSTLF
jgi:TolB protein